MKMLIILLLSCTPLFGADTNIRVIATSKTNVEKKVIFKREVFTRDGETNLVRRTVLKAGILKVRLQQIYHGGVKLVVITTAPHINHIETMGGSPYSVSFDYWPSTNLSEVVVWATNDAVVDAFSCKDGVLSPVESSLLGPIGVDNVKRRSNTALEPTPTAP